jgi:hypothetical protein
MLLVAAAVLRCSGFSSSTDAPEPSADASTDHAVAPNDAAADVTYERTGMVCVNEEQFCSVGESCCYGRGSDPPICAPSCGTAFDAGGLGYAYECGRTSDCGEGLVCCFEGNQVCGASNSITSHCLPKANCSFCYEEDGGTAQRGCDPALTTECPASLRCTLRTTGAPWHICAPP